MPGERCVVAVDVGGTSMKTALTDIEGRVTGRLRFPTPRHLGPQAVVAAIGDAVAELLREAQEQARDVRGIGVAVPGVVDEEHGVAVQASNIGWCRVDLRAQLTARFGRPCWVGHDVRAGAVAEARLGGAQGRGSVLFVPIGTGIGGALVIDGVPYAGANYAAAEIGHIRIPGSTRRCVCGRTGCLETVASGSAIAARYTEQTGMTVTGARDVAELAGAADPVATRIWQEAVEALADALETATTLFDPAVVVLGGGVATAGDALYTPLRERLPRGAAGRTVPILPAQLGDQAGCIGAALSIIDQIRTTAETVTAT